MEGMNWHTKSDSIDPYSFGIEPAYQLGQVRLCTTGFRNGATVILNVESTTISDVITSLTRVEPMVVESSLQAHRASSEPKAVMISGIS